MFSNYFSCSDESFIKMRTKAARCIYSRVDTIGAKNVNYYFMLCNLHPGTKYSMSLKIELYNDFSDAVNSSQPFLTSIKLII